MAGSRAAITAPAEPAPRAATATRTIYFSARGANGTPVTDLTIADLSLTAMGRSWPIVRLEKANAPIDISIILNGVGIIGDRYRFGVSTITDHLVEFLRQTSTNGTVSLMSLGHGPSKIVDYRNDPRALESALLELGRRVVPGRTDLADAVNQSAKELSRRRSARPVILVVTTVGEKLQVDYPGPRLGDRDYAGGEHAAMADAALSSLRRSGASLQVVAPKCVSVGQVLGSGSAQSGGIITSIDDDGLQIVRETLLSQYQLVYSVLDGYRADDRIVLRTDRPSVKIVAPTTAAR
jgi:hypothetical protein